MKTKEEWQQKLEQMKLSGDYKEPNRMWIQSGGYVDNNGKEVEADHTEAKSQYFSVERLGK